MNSSLLYTLLIAFWLLCGSSLRGDLVAHFPLNTDAVDAVGGREGTEDNVEFIDDGIFGGAAEFEGFGGIAVEFDEELNPESFSVSAWVNPFENESWNSVITSRAHAGDPVIVTGYIIYNTPNGEWDFWVGTGGPSGAWGRSIGPLAELDEWQHLAITYDWETDTKILYVNGVEEATSTGQGYEPNPQNQLTIGAGDDVGTNFFYTGPIDDVGIWNETLDEEAIQRIMSDGVPAWDDVGGMPGDFNGDNILDAADIDILTTAVRTGDMDAIYDVNGDGDVDGNDRFHWVDVLKNSYVGDSNLDLEFNSSDFVQVFQANEYEDQIPGNSTWATGDWDGDGDFDSSDFVLAFQRDGYERGPRELVNSVPEPQNPMLLFGVLLALGPMMRRRW